MPLEIIHDLEHALSQLQRLNPVRLPFIAGPFLHVGCHNEPPEGSLPLWIGVLVEHGRGNEEDRVGKSHQLDVQLGDEVPVVRIVYEARRPNREHAVHVTSFSATMSPEVSNAFHLNREAEAVVTANVDLVVPPLVICERGGNFDPSSATQHQALGELLLDDEALLDQTDRHRGSTSAWLNSGGLQPGIRAAPASQPAISATARISTAALHHTRPP